MSDSLPTIWQAEPHTIAKHEILTNYLKAWAAILSHQSARLRSKRPVTFIDGFAGPGEYQGGIEGSPIRAIRSVLERPDALPVPIHFYFIEFDADRFAVLQSKVEAFKERAKQSNNLVIHDPIQGDCNCILNTMLDQHDPRKRPFGPALVFLDQFGYGEVPMNLISRVLEHEQCEVLTYLEANQLNRFLADPRKDETRSRTFGDERWKSTIDLPPKKACEKPAHSG